MKAHNLKDTAALQTYFNQQLLPILKKHGKHMVGWDEIFAPGLPEGRGHPILERLRLTRGEREAGYSGIFPQDTISITSTPLRALPG